MSLPEVRMSFLDRAALQHEFDQNLKYGRAFLLQSSELPVLSDCTLVLVHPENQQELHLLAQVVMVNASSEMCGVGIALRNCGAAELARMQDFVATPPLAAASQVVPSAADQGDRWLAEPGESFDDAGALAGAPRPGVVAASTELETATAEAEGVPDALEAMPAGADAARDELEEMPADADAARDEFEATYADADASPDGFEATPASAEASPAASLDELFANDSDADLALSDDEPPVLEEELSLDDESQPLHATELQSGASKHEKLRHLNAAQQMKVARTGELAERITVERLYGKQVWDALLHNPRISVPEVARIARKGTVPKPLLEVILENGAWIKADSVRRALLSNPKLGAEAVLKLLRITPKHELKHIDKGTAYGMAVREAARKLLKQ
jgi:hypothetical protein